MHRQFEQQHWCSVLPTWICGDQQRGTQLPYPLYSVSKLSYGQRLLLTHLLHCLSDVLPHWQHNVPNARNMEPRTSHFGTLITYGAGDLGCEAICKCAYRVSPVNFCMHGIARSH